MYLEQCVHACRRERNAVVGMRRPLLLSVPTRLYQPLHRCVRDVDGIMRARKKERRRTVLVDGVRGGERETTKEKRRRDGEEEGRGVFATAACTSVTARMLIDGCVVYGGHG